MDQLKFRQSSLKKKHDHEETSQKKYGFKYYDYCDMVPNRHRIAQSILVHSVCQPKIRPINLRKSLNISKKTKRSVNQSHLTAVQLQNTHSSTNAAGNKSSKIKQYSLSEELRYYKVICKNLRKENLALKNQQQVLKKKHPRKKKNQNKENINNGRFSQLLQQLNAIESQLDKPNASAKSSYKSFYLNFIKSLKEIGISEPSNYKEALKRWKQILQSLSNNNTI